ncbi:MULTISPECIES: lipocalin family protein [Flavobacterium]|uniref:lipocalin family protein n=1 Tax=Flavobacterium TaxID=237 RepID=UPI001FCAB873|nr:MULTISPECIES: lipocalin family protein [Flavobacterium]UOK41156.1 lipocalin family protein [Flavobacterium enshiense]
MKNFFIAVVAAVLLVGCKQDITEKDLAKINGYWEIEKAELPDGSKKEYKINSTIDFFEIKGKKGFRKKVMPQLDGKYMMNDLSETIVVDIADGDVIFNYTTPYAKWEETIVSITDEKLVVKNDQDIEYYYKRAKPFSVK